MPRPGSSELLALPSPPTAVFGTNNRMTIGAALALARERPRVALVGFDDFELATALTPAGHRRDRGYR